MRRVAAFAMAGLLVASSTALSFGTTIYAGDEEEQQQTDTVIAFPGAEGGGMYATGGRGYDVYVVTNLDDYAADETPIEGSLRYGVENAGDGTMIVFNVGGTIHLKQTLSFKNKSNITLAGQTAPGDGITIAGYDTNISNSVNLIIRFIRFRPGAENVYDGGDSMDALWGRDNDTFIIDHCSFSWNTDETLSTYRGKNGTVQWCIISESLTVSGHSKGRHGYGGIFGGDNTVFQYNLIANHTSRSPRIGGGSMGDPTKDGGSTATLQISNNVVYNWGYLPCYGGGYTYTNFINNFLKSGVGTRDTVDDQVIQFGESGKVGGFYVDGNYMEGNEEVTADNSLGTKNAGDTTGDSITTESDTAYTADAFDQITLVSAQDCYDRVLNSAGATYPERDAIDARVVAETINDTGYYINTEEEVGGYCTEYAEREEGFDTDMDGMPDYWETEQGLDPSDASDGKVICADGYSNLEHYINSLVEGVESEDYVAPNPTVSTDLTNNTQIEEGQSVTVNATAIAYNGGSIAKVEFYNGSELIGTDTEAPYSYTYSDLTDGTYSITVRAYDNDDNETQSTTSKLHVNSTADTGEWTSADIGTPPVSGSASLSEEGILTVKGSGKLGRSEGSVSGTEFYDATTDDFQYTYQQVTGDVELVTKLDYATTVDNHVFTGIMFRESLDDDAKTAALGMSLVKLSNVTSWSTYLVDRTTTGGNIDQISETIDSASNALSNGISLLTDINFKTGATYNGTWFKLTRHGDVFTGYSSEDGITWTEVGSTVIDMEETFYIGFAVDANQVANDLENLSTAKFSDISVDTGFESVEYDFTNVETSSDNYVVTGEDLSVQLSEVSGYDLPASVSVTVDGAEADYSYDAETGIILVENVTGSVVITAAGVVENAVAWSLEEIDESDLLTIEADGSVMRLTQSATSGQMPQTALSAGINESYLVFPGTEDTQTLSLNLKVTDYGITGSAAKKTGVFIGCFNLTNHVFTTLGFRGYDSTVGTDSLSGYWTKASGSAGNGSPKYSVVEGDEYKVTFTKTSYGYLATFENLTEPLQTTTSGATYADERQFKLADTYMTSTEAVRYGIGIIGATVEITNLTLTDADGNVLYDQSDYYQEAGTAPTVTSVNTPTVNDERTAIEVSWIGGGAEGDGKYQVEVSSDNGATYEVLGTTTDTSYQYEPESSGNYMFRITGICGTDATDAMVSEVVELLLPMSAPTVDAQSGDGLCTITWGAVSEATGYRIKRSTEWAGEYEEIATTDGTSYVDTSAENEVPYYYTVEAYNDQNSSNPSTPVAIMATAGHTGEYVFGEDAPEITISDKSNDTVVDGSNATFTVEADAAGTFTITVNGEVVDTAQVAENQKVVEELALVSGRNEVVITFETTDGTKTYQNLNFVKLNHIDMMVDASYTGEDGALVDEIPTYQTVAAAVAAVPTDNNENVIILIRNGRYYEKLDISSPYISLIGEDADKTVLYYDVASGSTLLEGTGTYGTSGSASITVESSATGFSAENLTISNEFDYLNATVSAQAVAFFNKADQSIMTNVKFYGYQDTLFADGNDRQYYYKCYVEGCVDFIFGNAQAVFEDCDIVSNRSGYVTAASTESVKSTGYVFLNCRILAEDTVADGSVYLARPWRTNACVAYLNCYLGAQINTKGYCDMSGNSYQDAQYYEYQNYGPGFAVNTDRRQFSATQAAEFLSADSVFAREITTSGYDAAWSSSETYAAQNTAYAYEEQEDVDTVADYSAVDAAILVATALNAEDYEDFSAVTAAIMAVEKGLSSDEQARVDEMAKAITDAIKALVKKDVTEPETDPAAEQVEEPETESETDPATEQVEDPETEPETDPAAEQVEESETESTTEQVEETETETVTNSEENETTISEENEETSESDSVQTADGLHMALYFALLLLAVGVFVVSYIKKKSKVKKLI